MATRRFIHAVVVSGLVTGCTVGPNFRTPPPPAVDQVTASPLPPATADNLQRFQVDGAVVPRWWTQFGSPGLDALEGEALHANPDLKAAEAALRQARELYLAQRGTLLPEADFEGTGTHARNSATIAPLLANNASTYTLYQAQLNLSYDFDLFGGLKRQVEAVGAQADMQRFQTEAAYLTLTANVAQAAITLAGLRAQLAASTQIADADRRLLALTRQQQAQGELATTDIATAQAQLEQAEQAVPPLRQQIGQQRDLLAALTGRAAADAPDAPIALADLTLPRDLPVSLPSQLVRQRPDILAAEANLHAASAQVGVAVAARLPGFVVSGQLGGASETIGSLLSPDNLFASVTGTLAQSVFDGGQLHHKQKAAEAALDQAKAQYRSTVLGALQGTADVLHAIVEDADVYTHAIGAESAAGQSLHFARQQAAGGETGALPLLSAQAALAQADVTLAQAHTARYSDTIALFVALGGGWWNDPAAPDGPAHAAR